MRTRCSLRATPWHLHERSRLTERYKQRNKKRLLSSSTTLYCSSSTAFLNVMVPGPRLLSMSYPGEAAIQANEPTCFHTTPTDYPIVIDTGASISVSPNIEDFVDGISDANVKDVRGLNHSTTVHGMGMVEWTVYDVHHSVKTIRTMAFYVPDATIRLFSPQTYFLEGDDDRAHLFCDKDQTILTLHNGEQLVFPYNWETNLPFMLPATQMHKAHTSTRRREPPKVGLTHDDIMLFADPDALMGLMTVADEANQNLTATQKELLQWHWKLGHCNFQWVQALAAKPMNEEESALLKTKSKISAALPPLCAACQLAK